MRRSGLCDSFFERGCCRIQVCPVVTHHDANRDNVLPFDNSIAKIAHRGLAQYNAPLVPENPYQHALVARNRNGKCYKRLMTEISLPALA